MTTKQNEEEITKLKSSLNRLKDDMAMVQNELKLFKQAVSKDISKLVETSIKMKNDPKMRPNG
tara:strand:+ start:1826 stop:2014 length:189 start_codon:yes stop_codon:yes gene_type:complete